MRKEVKDKIQNVSFQMFRDWTAQAKEEYPDYDFTIIDETILVDDLTNSIQSAVNTLKKEPFASERDVDGYDTKFILKFIRSDLNAHWVREYIRKRSNDYKTLLILKSLQLYLEIEDIALIKIDEIYKKMFLYEVNFENIYFKPDKNKFSDFDLNLKIDINTDSKNNISISLDNMIIEKIVKLVKEKNTFFLPETKKYFSESDVMIFISEF